MSKWISVEERLPEQGQLVLVWGKRWFDDAAKIIVAYYSGDWRASELAWTDDGIEEATVSDVTHWQPLPERPE